MWSLFDWKSHTHSYVLTYLVVVLTEDLYTQCLDTCSPEVTLYPLWYSHIVECSSSIASRKWMSSYDLIFLLFHICYINEFNEYVLKTYPISFYFVVVGVTSRGQGLCTWLLCTKYYVCSLKVTVPQCYIQGCGDVLMIGRQVLGYSLLNAQMQGQKLSNSEFVSWVCMKMTLKLVWNTTLLCFGRTHAEAATNQIGKDNMHFIKCSVIVGKIFSWVSRAMGFETEAKNWY